MKWLSRLAARFTVPRAVRIAQDKRQLQAAAQEAGCSKSQAMKIVSLYFQKRLESQA